MSQDEDPTRPSRIADMAIEATKGLDKAHEFHIQQAQEIGYVRDTLGGFAMQIREAPDFPGLADTEETFREGLRLLENYNRTSCERSVPVASIFLTATAATAVSDIVCIGLAPHKDERSVISAPNLPPWWNLSTMRLYAAQLDGMRPSLGSLLLGAWEALYATRHEAGRTALLNIRELFNQLFECVAPDEEVRCSQFFQDKEDDKVHRRERLHCAVNKATTSETVAQSLTAQIPSVLNAYKDANELHRRELVSNEAARGTFIALFNFMKEILDALAER